MSTGTPDEKQRVPGRSIGKANPSIEAAIKGVSPAASGPAGAHFEGQVGASYLLALLSGTEPRGLPGTLTANVEFQRSNEDHFLDDVIIHAHDTQGKPATLAIQVKRTATFAPADKVFRSIVVQIAQTMQRPDFWSSRYELGIAVDRTSGKIGSYQDVLTWARKLGDAETFISRINLPGAANDDMRAFVQTFRAHLKEAGAVHDDETLWNLLRRLQIFSFDFTTQGSASEELAKELAVRTLHPDNAARANNLWTTLIEFALQVAASGGDSNRDDLIEHLQSQSFRLAGDRRFLTARRTLGETAHQALADINDRIGGALLTRHEHVASVRAALEKGRYVEIRGDAGVGKSGILKHFAEQLASEVQIIVFSPNRTFSKGWGAVKAALGFDGTLPELLSDMAGSGSVTLFIDNLDFFSEEERRTVVDFVREASKTQRFSVIATARRDFGVTEPNWLPEDSIAQLGRATPVVIDELNEAEISELKSADPRLVHLLADNHPARNVTRNLFRLSRLVTPSDRAPVPHTEVEMAWHWWDFADGKKDNGHRERTRVLKALAQQVLSQTNPLDTITQPAAAVNALVASETLREFENDKVAFRHDVLREWAIASCLFSNPDAIKTLPLDRSAPASLVRGIELTAQMMLERSTDAKAWQTLLGDLSQAGSHGSWRRAALIGLVRSEIIPEMLDRISPLLLDNGGQLLCELIRTVMAVDVIPARKAYEAVGVDPSLIPESLNVPNRPSWYHLLIWLLNLGEALPVQAIPDVVKFYTAWSTALWGQDRLTPIILSWFLRWLKEIETAREARTFRDWREPFNGQIGREQISELEDHLRTGFLMFCNKAPNLAVEYMQALGQYQRNDNAAHGILKFRGALAQAAPKELAELTANMLIADKDPEDEHYREAFRFLDRQYFLPVSPVQGPFFELLLHAPEHGLSLIHRLVDHAVSFRSGGKPHGRNAITISLPEGEHVFTWQQTYAWPRERGNAPFLITSALMALEAWAHKRIEDGEDIGSVLKDVIGSTPTHAAYLMVAVDILISHWPKSREAAMPFLACPELLCLDRERNVLDNFEVTIHDLFGFKDLQKEPLGAVSVDNLKSRPSRRHTLEVLFRQYAVGPAKPRNVLIDLLHRAADSLGPPNQQSTIGDPPFMAVHALNLINPENWSERTITLKDGTVRVGHEYVSPAAEDRHLQALQETSREQSTNTFMQTALRRALDNPDQSSEQLATAAISWAQKVESEKTDLDDELWMREEAIVIAAMIVARDGYAELLATHRAWVRSVFVRALAGERDAVHQLRGGLAFNPIAIAFTGLVYLMEESAADEDIRLLLQVAVNRPAAAHGFTAVVNEIESIDERLLRSILRCAFAACIRPHRAWDMPEEEMIARSKVCDQATQVTLESELAWLSGKQTEPTWPEFPMERVRPKRRMRLPGGSPQVEKVEEDSERSECYADHQVAALWLRSAARLFDVAKNPWLRDIIATYSTWTSVANGAGLDDDEDANNIPREWNDIYYNLLASCLSGLSVSQIDEIAIAPIATLPDEAFFDAMTPFLRNVDIVYFENRGLQEAEAIHIRQAISRRMMESRGWQWLGHGRSTSIEVHIGPAVAVLFFNDYGPFQPPKCYLSSKGVDLLSPFLPTLQELVEKGACFFNALVALNLLEVSSRSEHLSLIVAAGKTWLASHADDTIFWVDNRIGHRLCSAIEKIFELDPKLFIAGQSLRSNIDHLLASLVSIGVSEAHRLEDKLNAFD